MTYLFCKRGSLLIVTDIRTKILTMLYDKQSREIRFFLINLRYVVVVLLVNILEILYVVSLYNIKPKLRRRFSTLGYEVTYLTYPHCVSVGLRDA